MASDFYITLSAPDLDGNQSNFKVNLSYQHDLSREQWEIGLVEIHFTPNWAFETPAFDMLVWCGGYDPRSDQYKSRPPNYTVDEVESSLLNLQVLDLPLTTIVTSFVQIPAGTWVDKDHFGFSVARRMQASLNSTIDNLVEKPTKMLKLVTIERIHYECDHETKWAGLFMGDPTSRLGVSTERQDLMAILGIAPRPEDTAKLAKGGLRAKWFMFDYVGDRTSSGFPSTQTIFVYSSVCAEHHVRYHSCNLLRAVPVTAERGKRQCERYSTPTYVKLRPSTLDSIDIQLCDETGAELKQNISPVMLLHVRRKGIV